MEGEAIPVAERVGFGGSLFFTTQFTNLSVSETGVLVYGYEGSLGNRLVWMDRSGKPSPVPAPPGIYSMPRLSPDGSKLAVAMHDMETGNEDIWQIDLVNGTTTRFTFDPAPDIFPLWSPDGKQIVFGTTRQGARGLYRKAANGAGNEEPVTPRSVDTTASYDWSRNGRYLAYMSLGGTTGPDLWVFDMEERKAMPIAQTPFNESQGQFSPDGHWVAYSSDETGHYEVYVRNLGGTPARFQVSAGGGAQPRWRGDGKELYYVTPEGKMMAVTVKTGPGSFERETPRKLFESRALVGSAGSGPQGYLYDVTRDGRRFLCVELAEDGSTEPLTVVTNWQAGLKR